MPEQHPDPEVAQRLARRYPQPRLPRTLAVVAIALVAALGIGWVVWVGVDHATPSVSGRLDTFEIVDDTEAEFTLRVERRDLSATAQCRVIAQADNFERVGELMITVTPDQPELVVIHDTIRTFRRATSVSLDGCYAE